MKRILYITISLVALLLQGCVTTEHSFLKRQQPAQLQNKTKIYNDLVELPPARGKIAVSVYNFRDQTGQYKTQPSVSSFSTAITQGTTSILVQALKESNWFIPVEREGLNDLLTERKIIRASLDKNQNNEKLPPLKYARIMIEGGITGYDTNIVTGGSGIKYFGIGGSGQYRTDQVTVHLRAVDIYTGQILNSVSTTKTIYSREVQKGIFQFVSYKRLLEYESGYTTNEPKQLCVTEAIEKAVLSIIVEGVLDRQWALQNPADINSEIIQDYIKEKRNRKTSTQLFKNPPKKYRLRHNPRSLYLITH